MRTLIALSLAPAVDNWLANSSEPRILHVFDRACNLINEHKEVLSIVTPEIGNGPFNLVVSRLRKSADSLSDRDALQQTSEVFADINVEAPVSILGERLSIGDLMIHTADAKLWNPCPEWQRLHAKRENTLKQSMLLRGRFSIRSNPPVNEEIALSPLGLLATTLPFTNCQSLVYTLSSALAHKDISSTREAASKLAGLGSGLTPSGDDILLGAMYAAWIIHPPEVARALAQEIADTAAPLTTSLSAAWLKAGARGEAGELWHDVFKALLSADSSAIQLQITRLLAVGHTSGADALTGFVSTILARSNL